MDPYNSCANDSAQIKHFIFRLNYKQKLNKCLIQLRNTETKDTVNGTGYELYLVEEGIPTSVRSDYDLL